MNIHYQCKLDDEMFVLFSPTTALVMLGSRVDWTGCLGLGLLFHVRTITKLTYCA